MITLEGFMDIITLHRQGLSQRKIAENLGLHRKTVKKYIESNTLPTYTKTIRQSSIIDPFRQLIDDYLAEDAYQTTWIFDRLQKSGYQGSYKTVQEYVHSVKDRRQRLAYSRFETEPGLQAQELKRWLSSFKQVSLFFKWKTRPGYAARSSAVSVE
jgi:transposase